MFFQFWVILIEFIQPVSSNVGQFSWLVPPLPTRNSEQSLISIPSFFSSEQCTMPPSQEQCGRAKIKKYISYTIEGITCNSSAPVEVFVCKGLCNSEMVGIEPVKLNNYRLLHGLYLYFPDIFTLDPAFPSILRVSGNTGSWVKISGKYRFKPCNTNNL